MGAETGTRVRMRPLMELDAENLAEAVFAGLDAADRTAFIFELLESLDIRMDAWAFSLRLVRHTLKLAQQYTDEEYSEGGTEHTRLSGAIGEVSDALGRELRIRFGIEEKP